MNPTHSPAPSAAALSAALAALWIAVESQAEQIGSDATALVNLPEMTEARKLTLLAPESAPSPSGDVLGALRALSVAVRDAGKEGTQGDLARAEERARAALANAGNLGTRAEAPAPSVPVNGELLGAARALLRELDECDDERVCRYFQGNPVRALARSAIERAERATKATT